jgi:hypothetical protein
MIKILNKMRSSNPLQDAPTLMSGKVLVFRKINVSPSFSAILKWGLNPR